MANYATLKAAVENVVKTNGAQEITGENLQTVLLSIINSIGANYTLAGVATPSTIAGTPDQNLYYIAPAGTYSNFGTTVTIPNGYIGLFKYNGSWTNELIKTADESITKEIETSIGKPSSIEQEETYTSKAINISGNLFDASATYSVVRYDVSEYEYAYLNSNASSNEVVYAYTIQDINGNVLSHASKNITEQRMFFVEVPAGAKYLYVCVPDYVFGIEDGGYILDNNSALNTAVDGLLSADVKYRDLFVGETLPNKFIDRGNIVAGNPSWYVNKYSIAGLTSTIHLYTDAPVNEYVYAYTIQDESGNPIEWATVTVGVQREFTIDLSTIEGASYLYVGNPRYVQAYQKGTIPTIQEQIAVLQSEIDSEDRHSKVFTETNNILWLGTSIPEGSTYPAQASNKCGYVCTNNAYGGSCLCWSNTHPSTVNQYSGRCLTATVAELETIFRQDVTGGTITEQQLEAWKNKSYERSLIPYINGTNETQVSMIVLDHGFNDRSNIYQLMQDVNSIDWTSRDRSNFVGAFNYLMDKIQEIKPTIKIVISGYFQNTYIHSDNPSNDYHSAEICAMQELIAEHYSISIMKAWEHTQINNSYIAGTADYIANFNAEYGTSYSKVNPDAQGNIKSMQLYCPDMVHPHSDLTGNCNKRLNAVYAKLLADLI